jgi:hypothetical protein
MDDFMIDERNQRALESLDEREPEERPVPEEEDEQSAAD